MRAIVVCSWNIHECVGRDGRRDPRRVAAVLEEIGADVVALQEVHSDERQGAELDQARFLARSLSAEAVSGPTLERGGGRYGNVVLTRLSVRDVRRGDLSVASREPRGALEVTVEAEGERLRVAATHLGLRAAERRTQARRLLAWLGERGPGEILLLLGDLNEWRPWGAGLRLIRARFGPSAAPRTFPAWRPLLALDRVHADPRGRLESVRAHHSPAAIEASDHLPLVARLTPADGEGR